MTIIGGVVDMDIDFIRKINLVKCMRNMHVVILSGANHHDGNP